MNPFGSWLAAHGIDLGVAAATVAILAAGLLVSLVLNRALRRWLAGVEGRFHLPYQTVLVFSRALTATLWICVTLILLSTWGVGVTGLWAFLVSAFTAIGVGFLATWTMVSNVTASFFLTLWHPFRLGQNVELLPEGVKGRVIERNAMYTILREADGSALHVPNNLFFQKFFRVARGAEPSLFETLESGGAHAPQAADSANNA
jgi:small-conductance mechanosensitive channel